MTSPTMTREPETRPDPGASDRLVRDLMSHDPVSVYEGASLGDAADLLFGFDISALPVVDEDGLVVGVISQTDLVRLRGRTIGPRDWHRLPVSSEMTIPAAVISGEETVRSAARRMTELGVHRLFIVDRERAVIGVLSASDVIAEIAESDE